MISHLDIVDLKLFCRDKKVVYWHPAWIKVKQHLEQDFSSGEKNPIKIIKVWEDKRFPEIFGISFETNKRKGYIAVRKNGRTVSDKYNYPIFIGEKEKES